MATSKTNTPQRGISVELFEKINEATCVDLAIGIESLEAVVKVGQDDTEVTLHYWYPVLECVRRQLQGAKDRIEILSDDGYRAGIGVKESSHAAP